MPSFETRFSQINFHQMSKSSANKLPPINVYLELVQKWAFLVITRFRLATFHFPLIPDVTVNHDCFSKMSHQDVCVAV